MAMKAMAATKTMDAKRMKPTKRWTLLKSLLEHAKLAQECSNAMKAAECSKAMKAAECSKAMKAAECSKDAKKMKPTKKWTFLKSLVEHVVKKDCYAITDPTEHVETLGATITDATAEWEVIPPASVLQERPREVQVHLARKGC